MLLLLTACGIFGYGPPTDKTDDSADTADNDTGELSSFDCSQATFLGSQPDFPSSGTVRGRVTSPSGTIPVSGATLTVEVDGETAWVLSAEKGCFNLDLPPGSYDLVLEKGQYTASASATVSEGEVLDLGSLKLDAGNLKLAVVLGKYDSVQLLIDHLGIDYDTFAKPGDLYDDLSVLNQYDAVFSNCGSDLTTLNGKEYSPEQIANVRAWVEAGGTLYTSDWEWELFQGALPDAASWKDDPKIGPQGTLVATLEDRNIQALLGKETAEITFDLPGWAVPESAGEVAVLVSAKVEGKTRPLAIMAFPGAGRAIFTSFHNESQVSDDMQLILYELILALSADREPAPEPLRAEGVVYQFRTHTPLEGALVTTLQHPELQAVTDSEGRYTLVGLPEGEEFTLLTQAADHVPTTHQTLVADGDVDMLYVQLVHQDLFSAMAAGLAQGGVEVDLQDKCHVVTTVSAPEAGDATTWEEFLAYGDAGNLPGATADIVPAGGFQLYFNEEVQPDPSLQESTSDGGVLWVNLDPGRYTLSAEHPDHEFPDLTIDCAAGRFVNAAPPYGLTALN